MTITKRLVKGSELSYAEMDANFTDLDERTVVLETANSTSSQVTNANIGSLLNVDTTGVINGQVLKYDSNANKWKPSSDLSGGGSGGGIALTDLSLIQSADSGLGSATYNSVTGQFTIAMPDLTPYAKTTQLFTTSDVDSHLNQSNPTNGYVLSWNGSDYTWVDNGVITETDPIFTASPASTITNTKITNWDTSYGWGDHSVEGYLKSETDPIFTASPASTITNTKITNWDTSYGWGDHSTAGYLTSFTETNTSLSLATNILKYTDEAGAVTNIDLSLYLDDTNLAKLTSGTIDGATGIATFLRDDASSFTVDFSQLFDDTNLSRIDSATFASGTLTLTRSDASTASTVSLDGRYLQNLAAQDTDNLSEGSTNLYYTQARFNSALSTKSTTDLSEGNNLYYTDARVDARITNAGLFDGDYNSLTNLPTLFNGQFGSLTGKPTTISGYGITDAFDGDYTNLTNKPTLFDGKFSSLTNTPTTIAGYGITDALALGTTSTTALAGDTALFDGDYTNLTNKPTIPAVLTDLSISDGTNGQILTTDGSGNFTFQSISAGGSTTLSGLTDTTIASVQQFQSLQWSGTKWVNAYPNTQHLSNVDRLNNPTNGDTLVWNALNNQYEYSQAVVSDQALSTTDDVTINRIATTTTVTANAFQGKLYDTNGNVLLDNTSGAAGFGGNISSNGSSSFSGTVDFNGATINNLALSLGDLSNVDPVAPTTGHVLKWGGSQWAPGLSGDMPTSGGTFTGDVTFASGKIIGPTNASGLGMDIEIPSLYGLDLIYTGGPSDEFLARFGSNGAVQLYHNGNEKVKTSPSGITVTGAAAIGSALTINETNLTYNQSGSGNFQIISNKEVDMKVSNSDRITLRATGAVDLYHSGSKKLETTATGVAVTGTLTGVTDITTGPASGSPSINLGDGTGNFGNPIINFNAGITGVSGHITHIANSGFEIKSNSGGEYIRLQTYDSSHFTPLEVVGNVVTISQAYTLPSSDGTTGQVLQTNGAGVLSFTSLSSGGMVSLADDTTPQLGGALDSNNHDVVLKGTGPFYNNNITFDASQDILHFEDGMTIRMGTGSGAANGEDFWIFHDGTNSYIEHRPTAPGKLMVNSNHMELRASGGYKYMSGRASGGTTVDEVKFYFGSNSEKLALSADGITVSGNITTTGYIAGPATLTIDPAAVGDDTGTVVIAGDLQVDGTTTTVNSATLDVADINITVAKGAANAAAANGAGLTVDGASATLTYASAGDNWAFNKPLDMGSNNITTTGQMLYSNVYSAEVDLPNASTYHGMFAHVHGTGKGYFAHSGNWIALQNENALEGDVDTHLKTTSAGIGQVLGWTGSDFNWVTMSSGLGNIVEDISPQLGGPLDVNGKVITSSSNGNIQIKPAGTGHTEFENEIQFVGTSYTTEWLSVGHWSFRDGVQARFGSTDDLVIKHDGSNSYIDETGTGNLIIKSSFLDIKDASNVELISADASEVRLRQGGNIKLKTASTGVDVTGDVSLTGSITSTAVGTPTITSSTDIVLAANSGSGIVNVSGSKITNLGTPTSTSDAATKAYVDANAGGGSAFTTPEVKTSDWSVTNADKGKVYIVDTDNLTLTLPEDSTLDSDWFIRIYTKGNSFQPSYGSVGDLTIDPQYSLHGGRVNGNTNWIMRARQGGILFVDPEASDNFLFDTHSTNWDIDVNSTANANRANATGWGGVAISGQATAQGTGAVAIGYLSYATGNDSIAIGGNSAQAVATDAIALGNSYAGGTQSFAAAIDNNTSSYGALNPHSIAIGYQAKAAADRSTAIGYTAQVTGNHASAYGHGSSATGAGSNSLGYGSSASGAFANAIGSSAVAIGDNSVAFTQARASGSDSFAAAISSNSSSYGASATNAVALGYYAKAAGDFSVAIGKNASATGNDTIALGGATTLVKVDGTLDVSGFKVSGDVEEKFTTLTSSSSIVAHDCSTAAIFYHTGATGDFTINLTNINSTQEYAKGIAVVVNQGATAYMPTALQIGGSVQTINWQGGSAPSGTDSGIDIVSFTILNDGGTYVVLGQSVAYS